MKYQDMKRMLQAHAKYPNGLPALEFPKLLRAIPDQSGGPPMPRCEFDVGNGNTLLVSDSFYGASYILNPGARGYELDSAEIPKEVCKYIMECFRQHFGDPIKRTGG